MILEDCFCRKQSSWLQIFLTQESNWGLLHCRWLFSNWAIREAWFLLRIFWNTLPCSYSFPCFTKTAAFCGQYMCITMSFLFENMVYVFEELERMKVGLIFLWASNGPKWLAWMDLLKRKQSFMSACRNCIDFSKMHNDVCRVPEGKIKLIRLFSCIWYFGTWGSL